MRVLRITHSRVIALVCAILATARFSFTISITLPVIRNGTIGAAGLASFRWRTLSYLSCGVLSDCCITACLCATLLRRKTGFDWTDKLINTIVSFTVGESDYSGGI